MVVFTKHRVKDQLFIRHNVFARNSDCVYCHPAFHFIHGMYSARCHTLFRYEPPFVPQTGSRFAVKKRGQGELEKPRAHQSTLGHRY